MKSQLVLDANAFIHHFDLQSLHEQYDFVSTNAALSEVRDLQARESLRNLPFKIQIKTPSDNATKFVKHYALATGDAGVLSPTDIEIIAVAYTIIEEQKKTSLVRKQPSRTIEFSRIVQKLPPTFTKSQDTPVVQNSEDEEWQTVEDDNRFPHQNLKKKQPETIPVVPHAVVELPVELENDEQGDDDDETDESDQDDWITLDNIQDHISGVINADEEDKVVQDLGVAILTADFAMQNVLLQMGIPIISQEGFRVKQARRFILECHICKILVRDPSKLFCPECGNDSLLKVSCSVVSDGTIILYRRRNFTVNNRGSQYSVPKQSLQRHEQLIVREDQLLMGGVKQKIKREQRQSDKKYKLMMLSYENGMGFDDVDFKQSRPQTKLKVGYGRLNPNDTQDMKKIKMKRSQK